MELVLQTILIISLLGAGWVLHHLAMKNKAKSVEKLAEITLQDAKRESQVILKEAKLHAKDETIKIREGVKSEFKSQRKELQQLEERLAQRDSNLDRKVELLDKKEQSLEDKLLKIEDHKSALLEKEQHVQSLIEQEGIKIQQVSEMSKEDARTHLLNRMEEEVTSEAGALARRIIDEAKANAEREARKIITMAIERYAADQVNEITTCTVHLPNDEMKGRIIGREGRNIRSLEAATGVNILIDDTPEVVVISGFDPLRREVARITLERLINDGRIHPGRIEEVVEKVQEEIEETIRQAGEAAIYELGLQGVAPELVRTIGKLKYRTSYSQNVLYHSIEMGHLMGNMASELDLNPIIARRIGLFHDIGKALTHEVEGSHAIIGADLIKRHGEEQIVVNAVAAHHHEVDQESAYAVLATAADAMTAARPGARSETTEIYLKRLGDLEEIANSYRGVEKSYAIQAGRELRVLVEPGKIDDNEALIMARNISRQIEDRMTYPGQIKVTVVRETRCVEFAR